MEYPELVKIRHEAFTGDIVKDALCNAYNMGAKDRLNYLPDVEEVSAKVHEAWIQSKLDLGVKSRKSESGEELMVPYEELSEEAKSLDRNTVLAVYKAMRLSES